MLEINDGLRIPALTLAALGLAAAALMLKWGARPDAAG
jgi:hypothetical protein